MVVTTLETVVGVAVTVTLTTTDVPWVETSVTVCRTVRSVALCTNRQNTILTTNQTRAQYHTEPDPTNDSSSKAIGLEKTNEENVVRTACELV